MIDFGPTAKLRTIEEIRSAKKATEAAKKRNRRSKKVRRRSAANQRVARKARSQMEPFVTAKNYRKALGITRNQMAERFGITFRVIENYETGRQLVPASILQIIHAAP